MLEFSEKNKMICEAIEKLPITEEFIPLYIEILSHTTSPLIWGAFADMLKDICSSNPDFMEVVLDLLEDPKTVGARGYLLRTLNLLINGQLMLFSAKSSTEIRNAIINRCRLLRLYIIL